MNPVVSRGVRGSDADPIAALATTAGTSETALVRVSGRGTHAILAQIFVPDEAHPVSSRTVARGSLRLSLEAASPSHLPALVIFFSRGHSYTGEESAEILLPGAPIWSRALLADLESRGVAPAGPGEFTRRAFENGRLDLTRAESVAALIAAEDRTTARAARRTLDGALADAVRAIADRLHDLIALLEAGLDFADQEVEPPSPGSIDRALAPLVDALAEWTSRPDAGGSHGENARLLLWGRTNAGKSTLLNALSGHDCALVSEEEGTTTDPVSATLETAQGPIELLDLPGTKGALTTIEALADDLARRSVAEEDPILYLFDATRPPEEVETEWGALEPTVRTRAIVLFNKIDRISESERDRLTLWPEALFVSAETGEGLPELRERITDLLRRGEFVERGHSLHFNDRQRRRISECRKCIEALRNDLSAAGATEPELVVVDLRRAHQSLEEITGEIVTEETLTRIFSRFCVGK